MVGAKSIPPGDYVPTADQKLAIRGIPWSLFEAFLEARGDDPVPRVAYSDGVLELMNPSRGHESK